MTVYFTDDKIVANETVSFATIYIGVVIMPKIMRRMNIISRCAGLYRAQQLEDAGLRPVHHSYILMIYKNEGKSQDWLARQLCLSKSNVTRHITYLENEGYIERRPDENDKRQMLVYPTDKLRDIYPRVRKITDEWNAYVSDGITDKELEAFHSTLDKMLERAQELASRGK